MEMVLKQKRERLSVGFSENKTIILLTLLLTPFLTLISPKLAIIFVYAFGFWLILKSDYKFLIFFACFIFMQNFILLIFANKFTSTTNTLFSLSKEIMLYAFCFKSLFVIKGQRKKSLLILLIVCYVLLTLVSFFRSDAELMSKIIAVRQLFLPMLCFFFGYSLNIDEKKRRRFFDLIVVLSVITAIIGFFDFFMFKDLFWARLPFERYQVNKGSEFDLYKGVPLNFYTWDFIGISGKVIRRLVSIQTDPLTTAHTLFLGFVLTEHSNLRKKKLIKLILLIASILTFSKGVYICYAVCFILFLLRKLNYKQFRNLSLITILILAVSFSTLTTIVLKVAPDSSTAIHIKGLLSGFANSSIFGSNVGNAGVMVSIKTGIQSLSNESYVGVVLVQLGIVGFVLYILFNVCLIFRLYYFYSKYNRKDVFVSICLLLAIFLESFLSESSIGIVATGLYFIIAGQTYASFNTKKMVRQKQTEIETNNVLQTAE